mmetsp:Transcript_3117/g.3512  ORF Transcript_3117/g.3512 Transcript_3117/m.3512 type:complete len:402 (-) Transcript_3117:206-1411(-)|eukprot:CAMPEP_0170774636 /NCGR_PEP_ID=MMETSP0733-20121128/10072_1 /TAXON_ID=186038 /ORGANISM="Fragilariopsis kerguelensis, Strain L26-C5" /LENGTH=401 /DNA_ID=CAMNT_0011117223 /DNA_START=190 /DNA_END=1395 /DNA_ORIENTATION=+
MVSTLTLSDYSKQIKAHVLAVQDGTLNLKGVVTGNQASDMDSICCALTLAYLFTMTECAENEVYLPLVACHREDATMRGETVFALHQAGVEMTDLVFGDDDCVSMLFDQATDVVLCDHCKADDFSQQGASKVCTIIDHHVDQHAHPQCTGFQRKIAQGHLVKKDAVLQLIGSCSSAVVEFFLALPNGLELIARDKGAVAIVLYSVMLIDTKNMSIEVAKATDRDIAACALTSHLAEGLPSQEVWYQQLSDAKNNIAMWRDMSAEQILRYDLKAFLNDDGTLSVGISSILCSIEDFVAKPGWQEVLSTKTKANGYHFYIVLCHLITGDGTTQRQQLFFSDVPGRVAAASDFFRHTKTYDYQYSEPLEIPDDPVEVLAFNQFNKKLSRKAVGPTSIEFLNSEE